MDTLEKILYDLDLPKPAQIVYRSLLEKGQATARLLSERTGMTRPSVYDQLKILRSRGLVIERLIENKAYFSPDNPERLQNMLEERIEGLQKSQDLLAQTLPTLLRQGASISPRIRFFEGKAGGQQLLKDILWYDDLTLFTFWPYGRMLDTLGKEFLLWFNERREKRNMKIEAIWPASEKKREHIFGKEDWGVERRYLKTVDRSGMSYLIYDTKVAFISSSQEAFGFIVESREFQELMQIHFDLLWKHADT